MPDLWGCYNGEDDSPRTKYDPLANWSYGSGEFFSPIEGMLYSVQINNFTKSEFRAYDELPHRLVCYLLADLKEGVAEPDYFGAIKTMIAEIISKNGDGGVIIGFHSVEKGCTPMYAARVAIEKGVMTLISFERGYVNYYVREYQIRSNIIVVYGYDGEYEIVLEPHNEGREYGLFSYKPDQIFPK